MPILVSDFDGTLTRHDFFRLAMERLVPPGLPDYWTMYRTGQLTHFEVLRDIFASVRATEEDVLAVVHDMGLDPDLASSVAALRKAGWEVIVASAGCGWYIRRLLQAAGVELEVHANHGEFVAGKGLRLMLPTESRYFSPTHGIDKAAVVRAAQQRDAIVAFAGDGYPDLPAARLVSEALRFGRADLADALREAKLSFRPFEQWSEVARALLSK
jgi:2-hydroxy-3-keto-5-methylthiopentenyl-1-phosphate phosphatase